MKKMYVTLDTEIDADIHWVKGKQWSFSSITEGIPRYYRPIWDEYQINPIYFVSPEVLEDDASCKVLMGEIERGAVIGAHLHPDFIEPEKTPKGAVPLEKFPCSGYEYEIEKAKIKNLRNKIKERFGVKPIWYRAARFGADGDTIKILSELGFKYDSSFTPGINWQSKGGPDHSGILPGTYQIEPYGIIEHSVTIAGKRLGYLGNMLPDHWIFYRWLRPTHMTFWEEKSLLREMDKNGEKELVMMFHSMEVMVNKTPYVRTKWMQAYFIWRLRKTLEFAQRLGYQSYSIKEDEGE